MRDSSQVVQSIGSSIREACLRRSLIISEQSSSSFEGGLVPLPGLCVQTLWTVKVEARGGGMI